MAHVLIDQAWLHGETRSRNIIRAIKKLGMSYTLSSTTRSLQRTIKNPPYGSFAIGSIPFIRTQLRYRPVGGETHTCFDDTIHYYSRYNPLGMGDYWLNRDYVLLPFAEVQRRLELLWQAFGTNKLILKPDSGLKIFEVQTLDAESLNEDFERLDGKVSPSSLCVVSPYQKIHQEFRFVVSAKGEVISGSRYWREGQLVAPGAQSLHSKFGNWMLDNPAKEALSLASDASKILGPELHDPLFVVDIAELTSGEFRIIELNCLSTSGLYGCHPEHVFRAIKESFF